MNWVDSGRTLREQGIGEGETVLLKRKFFFSDQNIDSRDPVQLNLLYVQARDAILNSTHPVTQQFACMFAGLQAHIQFGDHVESKHKPPFLELVFFVFVFMKFKLVILQFQSHFYLFNHFIFIIFTTAFHSSRSNFFVV